MNIRVSACNKRLLGLEECKCNYEVKAMASFAWNCGQRRHFQAKDGQGFGAYLNKLCQ